MCRAAGSLMVLLLVLATPASGQTIRIDGESADSASRLVARILERDDFIRIDRDTTLEAGSRIEGDLVLVNAVLRLAGEIGGSVAVLGGELFIRPGAVIEGPIAVAGGAVYPSRMARTGEVFTVPLETGVAVTPDEGGYLMRLTAPAPARRFRPSGIFGLAIPLYDRVSGLTLGWGTRMLLTGSEGGAFARVAVTYRTELGSFGGSAGLEVPVGRGAWIVAQASRATATNEDWIRGALANSAAAISLGSDARDYHESDAASFGILRRQELPLVQGESFLSPRLLMRISRDRPLAAGDPWKLFGEEWRSNPPVSEGTMASIIAGASLGWRGATSAFDGDAFVEWAPPAVGDFEFVQLVSDWKWSMVALWQHRIDLRGHTALPLGRHAAPAQRWSFVGGAGTLPTLEYGARRGDHVVYLRGDYSVPLRSIQLPIVGVPMLRASHATGSAWATGDLRAPWEQNLGAGVVFPLVEAMVWVDPAAEPMKPTLALGVTLPL